MVKCPGCKVEIVTAENCQLCCLAEQQLRKSVERKYIATLDLIDKFLAAANNIIGKKT